MAAKIPRKQLACASSHSSVITDKGSVFVWGAITQNVLSDKGNAVDGIHATEIVPDAVIESRKAPSALARHASSAERSTLDVRPESIACEEKAIVIVFKNGGVEEWRKNLKRQIWKVENPSVNIWLPRAELVACGYNHSLIIDHMGQLWTWGDNDHGELGLGDMQSRTDPTLVVSLEKVTVTRVAGGGKHSLCCTKDGDVYAFGYNENGQLGTGNQVGQSTPVIVGGLQKIIRDVACGASHSAAQTDDGKVYLFGAGNYGRCGHGYDGDVYYPVENETLSRVGKVLMCSLGDVHSACVTDEGHLYVWGSGSYHKLGLGEDESNKLFPTKMRTPLRFSMVVCGAAHTIAVLKDTGHIVSWGLHSSNGRLGRSLDSDASRPGFVEGIPKDETVGMLLAMEGGVEGGIAAPMSIPASLGKSHAVIQVAVGSFHTIVLTQAGTAFGFGSNVFGQCGQPHGRESGGLIGIRADEDNVHSSSVNRMEENLIIKAPLRINVTEGGVTHKVSFISCGNSHSLLINSRGALYVFGSGSHHQLGLGVVSNKSVPTLVSTLSGSRVDYVAGGETHSACITREGSLYTWGSAEYGKLGLGRGNEDVVTQPTLVHLPLELGDQARSVSCSSGHTLIVTKKGKLFACGAGFYGRLGTGKTRNEPEPVQVVFDSADDIFVTQASAGELHSTCVTQNGDLYTWGLGDARLGLGETLDKLVPTKNPKCASGGPTVMAAAGDSQTLVLTADGSVWSFGKNSFGKLGLGSDPRDAPSPERIKPEIMQLGQAPESITMPDHRMVSCRANHCLALSQDGRVYCWGAAGQGRLGLHAALSLSEVSSPRRLDDLEVNDESSTGGGASTDKIGITGGGMSTSMMEKCLSDISDFKALVKEMNAQSDLRLAGLVPTVSWKDIKIPIGAIQAFIKAKYRVQHSDQALKQQLKACMDWEAVNLHSLREFALKQGEFNNLEMTIAFAVEHISRTIAKESFAAVGRTPRSVLRNLSSSFSPSGTSGSSKKRRQHRASLTVMSVSTSQNVQTMTRDDSDGDDGNEPVVLTQHLQASLPFLERIMSLLLINPGLVFAIYQKLVLKKGGNLIAERGHVKWADLLFGLCRDLYALDDPHCERLFHRLVITLAKHEIEPAKSFALYGADFQKRSLFSRLFELFLLKRSSLSSIIKKRLRSEFTPFKKQAPLDFSGEQFRRAVAVWETHGQDSGSDLVGRSEAGTAVDKTLRDLSELAVKIFHVFESVMLEVVFSEYPGVTRVCFDFYAMLMSKFLPTRTVVRETISATSVNGSKPTHLPAATGHLGSSGFTSTASSEQLEVLSQISLFVTRFLYSTLFEPVLKEPSRFGLDDPVVGEDDFPDVATREAISKFIIHALSMSSQTRNTSGTTSVSFEASVASYQNLVRSSLSLKDRQEMDARLVEARSLPVKQQVFETLVEQHRAKIIREVKTNPADFNFSMTSNSGTVKEERFTGATGGYLEAAFDALEDVFRPLREQGIKLVRTELKRAASLSLDIDLVDLENMEASQVANLARDSLDVNLLVDLARAHLRFERGRSVVGAGDGTLRRPLVVHATRRTLEFVKYVVVPAAPAETDNYQPTDQEGIDVREESASNFREDQHKRSDDSKSSENSSKTYEASGSLIFSARSEWFVLQQLVKEYESEFGESLRLKNFEARAHELDDSSGIALTLDLRRLDLASKERTVTKMITSQSDSFERLHDLTRLDSVTGTPIPAQLVRDVEVRGDVLGIDKIVASIGNEGWALRDLLCRLERLGIDETNPEVLRRAIELEATKAEKSTGGADSYMKRFTERLPGGEDLVRLFYHMLQEVEFRERAMAMMSALRRAHEKLKEELDDAVKNGLGEVNEALTAYARVLRFKDTSRNRQHVEEIARRKGRAYRLTELRMIRSIQLKGIVASGDQRSTKTGEKTTLATCFTMFNPLQISDERMEILFQKRMFSNHGLIKGALVTVRYQILAEREVIVSRPRNHFGELHPDGNMCTALGTERTGECSLSEEYLAKRWPSISKKLMFTFFLSHDGHFSISVVFNNVTVVGHIDDHISSLVTRSRSFSLDWHPDQHFPVKFRVHKLLAFVQEMSLQSLM